MRKYLPSPVRAVLRRVRRGFIGGPPIPSGDVDRSPSGRGRFKTADDSPKGPEVRDEPLIADLRTPVLATGDPAFDFELPVYDFSTGERVLTSSTMRLSEVSRDRPVALIFGSYT
jgi:hypothetical protein